MMSEWDALAVTPLVWFLIVFQYTQIPGMCSHGYTMQVLHLQH